MWVLTGDKRETAVNVGKACNLLKDGMIVLQLTTESKSAARSQIETFLQLIKDKDYEELDKYNALREVFIYLFLFVSIVNLFLLKKAGGTKCT